MCRALPRSCDFYGRTPCMTPRQAVVETVNLRQSVEKQKSSRTLENTDSLCRHQTCTRPHCRKIHPRSVQTSPHLPNQRTIISKRTTSNVAAPQPASNISHGKVIYTTASNQGSVNFGGRRADSKWSIKFEISEHAVHSSFAYTVFLVDESKSTR